MNTISKLILLICLSTTAHFSCRAATPPPPPSVKHETSFVCFPVDTNSNPPMVFGRKLLSEMDRCAAVTVRRFLYNSSVDSAVTVAINNVKFYKPAKV